jgi:hypothetical protein
LIGLSSLAGIHERQIVTVRKGVKMAEIEKPTDPIETGDGDDQVDGLPAIEKKYQKQMRQLVSQKLDLPVSTLPAMLKEQIKLNPEFQRRDRWDETRQSRLIESLVMNVPIPPVFLGEDEYGQYVVLDGRQRLTAVSNFLGNNLKLKGLDVWDELNGMMYSDMIKRQLDKYLTRRFLQAIVLLKESSPIVKYDVFDRLNTGGVPANNMEIRNAVYRGKFTDLLLEVSRLPDFCKLWNVPLDELDAAQNTLYQQMTDLELVLRFFALYEHKSMSVRFKDYLSEFMDGRNAAYRQNPAMEREDRDRFTRAAKNCWNVFGTEAFYTQSRKRSIPLADAVMVAFADYPTTTITGEKVRAARDAVTALLTKSEFQKAIGSGTNGRGAIETRVELARQAVHAALA